MEAVLVKGKNDGEKKENFLGDIIRIKSYNEKNYAEDISGFNDGNYKLEQIGTRFKAKTGPPLHSFAMSKIEGG